MVNEAAPQGARSDSDVGQERGAGMHGTGKHGHQAEVTQMSGLTASGGIPGPAKDPRIQAWVGQHPGWDYSVTRDGRHLVKDPRGGVAAWDPDPIEALENARAWA
jgi:hypothetical protein